MVQVMEQEQRPAPNCVCINVYTKLAWVLPDCCPCRLQFLPLQVVHTTVLHTFTFVRLSLRHCWRLLGRYGKPLSPSVQLCAHLRA